MKFFSFVALFTGALVGAIKASGGEAQDWFACHRTLMEDFARRKSDDVASCNMWECFDRCGNTYGHSEGFLPLSGLLLPQCEVVRNRPSSTGNGPAESEELNTWKSCIRELARDFAEGVGDRQAACDAFVCLHRTEVEFTRGSVYSEVLDAAEAICAPYM